MHNLKLVLKLKILMVIFTWYYYNMIKMDFDNLIQYRDIWKIIFDLLDFKSQINLLSTCRFFYWTLKIIDLYNIDEIYIHKLTNQIIEQNKYKYLKKLNVVGECRI